MALLTRDPIHLEELIARVAAPDRGGIATFMGVVRNHHEGRAVRELEYSSYDAMAEAVAGEIILEAESRWPVRAAVRHRLGRLGVGDVAVAIAVAGGHRDEAFAACRYLIEALKARVPIWKLEFYVDGTEHWVGTATGNGRLATGREEAARE